MATGKQGDQKLVEHDVLTDERGTDLGTDRGHAFDQRGIGKSGGQCGAHRRRSSCSKVETAERK